MIKQEVSIKQWLDKDCVDGFEYVITAANGHGIAIMAQKGKAGLENA